MHWSSAHGGEWRAQIVIGGVKEKLGAFATEEAAATAYEARAASVGPARGRGHRECAP